MKKLHYFLLFCLTQLHAQCWKSVSAGGTQFTIAVKTDGTLWASGYNAVGQLGDGTFTNRPTFVRIGTDSDWKEVSAGGSHSLAIKNNGTLWAWGTNDDGELGIGNHTDRNQPTQVGTSTSWTFIKARGAGSSGIEGGDLYCWGRNNFGQLGEGTTQERSSPTPLFFSFHPWRSIAGNGTSFTLGIKENGTIWSWGFKGNGQLGIPLASFTELDPRQIGNDTDWKEISAGYHFCIALKTNGTLWAWGDNESGALGNPALTIQETPVQIGTDHWLHIKAGGSYCMAVRSDNTLWAWGDNSFGELGDGTTTMRTVPTRIGDTSDYEFPLPGGIHGFAKKTNGTLIGMGSDFVGELSVPNNTSGTVLFPEIINCPSLGTDDFTSNETALSLYPNPANEILHIHNGNDMPISRLLVFDLTGKIVLEENNTSEINVQILQKGIYILEIQSNDNIYQKKFVRSSDN